MQIAILIEDVSRTGGQERVIAELAPRLAQNHEIHLYCLTARDIDEELIHVHRLRAPCRFTMARALWFTFTAGRAARRAGHDLLLSQGGNSLHQDAVLCHTCQAFRATLWDAHWRLRPPTLFQRLVRRLWTRIVVNLERRAVRACRGHVAAVSDELKRQLMAYHGLQDEDVVVTPNGVDHSVFHPGTRQQFRRPTRRRLGLSDQDFVVVYVGGQWLQKGVTHLIDALAKMQHQGAHLLVVGSDDPAFFREYAQQRAVEHRVHFPGATPRPQEYYGAADCLGLPTGAEGFSLVALEAAACGLPVLMTRVGIAGELIQDGITGFLIEGRGDDIAAKLDFLAENEARRRQMGQAAAAAAKRFSWDAQAAALERLLVQAAASRESSEACAATEAPPRGY